MNSDDVQHYIRCDAALRNVGRTLVGNISVNFYLAVSLKPLSLHFLSYKAFMLLSHSTLCNSVMTNKMTPNRNATVFFKKYIGQFTTVTATVVTSKYGHFGPQTLRYLVSDNPKALTINLNLTCLILPDPSVIYYVSQYSKVTRGQVTTHPYR